MTSPASSTIEAIASDTQVFLDATIFVYHFTGSSAQCRSILERCERGDVKGVTSVVALAEVAHRLMMVEAVARKLVAGGNVARKLRERPGVVRELYVHREQVEKIPLMGVEVWPLDMRDLLAAGELSRRFGLLTNDAASSALARGIEVFASADEDFARVEGLRLHRPTDLELRTA